MIPKRQYRIVSQEEIDSRRKRGLSLDPAVLRGRGMLLPIAGGEETPEEKEAREKQEAEDSAAEAEAEAKKKKEEEEKKKKEGKKEDGEEDPEEDDEDLAKVSKNELSRLRRIAKEKETADKKAKKDKDDAERKRKEEAGEFEELLKDERDKTAAETKRADAAEEELKTFKFQVAVGKVAKDVGFKDPTDAFLYLDKEEHLESDERALERALKKVLDKKEYLKAPRTATGGGGGGGNGNGDGSHFSFDEISKMSSDEINANWDKPGFQEALKNSGRT